MEDQAPSTGKRLAAWLVVAGFALTAIAFYRTFIFASHHPDPVGRLIAPSSRSVNARPVDLVGFAVGQVLLWIGLVRLMRLPRASR